MPARRGFVACSTALIGPRHAAWAPNTALSGPPKSQRALIVPEPTLSVSTATWIVSVGLKRVVKPLIVLSAFRPRPS
jgi:hypothetical protein